MSQLGRRHLRIICISMHRLASLIVILAMNRVINTSYSEDVLQLCTLARCVANLTKTISPNRELF